MNPEQRQLRDDLFARQYAAHPGETFDQGMARVASVLYPDKGEDYILLLDALRSGEFMFGGRVLAGAGSSHGNLLNCFVQDGAPFKPGTSGWVTRLALQLALVTKVGGGNGLNLDSIPAKRQYTKPIRLVDVVIDKAHPDYEKVKNQHYSNMYFTDKPDTGLMTIKVEDSVNDIWVSAAAMVNEILDGRAVAIDLSALRPEGTPVKGSGGTSSGPASFALEVFDNFARWANLGGAEYAGPVAALRYVFAPTLRVIRQAGVRRGAGMATLSAEHADIRDFVSSKSLERERLEGDISTFNISVLVRDAFMGQEASFTKFKSEDFVKGEAEAHLLEDIAEQAWATGEPGLIYVDAINQHSAVLKSQGPILATNPCGEVPLLPGEPCDLGAINLAKFVTPDGHINYPRLAKVAHIATKALDRVLDVEEAPTKAIKTMIAKNRRIGLGVMGLADMLVKKGLKYGSRKARNVASKVINYIGEVALATSEGAVKVNNLPAPEGVLAAVQDGSISQPRRNIALLTVAPTGTISTMLGVSSGIEPIYSAVTYRKIGDEYVKIIHPLLKEILESYAPPLKYYLGTIGGWDWEKLVQDISAHEGSIRHMLDELVQDNRLTAFMTAHDIKVEGHVKMQGAIQRTFDAISSSSSVLGAAAKIGNSISKTINMPEKATVRDVLAAYRLAFQEGCKGITVYRDKSRSFQVLSTQAPVTDLSIAEQLNEYEISKEDYDNIGYEEAKAVAEAKIESSGVSDEEALRLMELVIQENLGALKELAKPQYDSPVYSPAPVETSSKISRPAVIVGQSVKYAIGQRKHYVQVFRNPEQQIVEVWTPAPKGASSEARTMYEIIGRLSSLALKYGVPVQELAETFEGHFDESGGMTRDGYFGSRWEILAQTLRDQSFTVIKSQENEASFEHEIRTEASANLAKAARNWFEKTQVSLPQAKTVSKNPDCTFGRCELVKESGCTSCQVCGWSKCG